MTNRESPSMKIIEILKEKGQYGWTITILIYPAAPACDTIRELI